ncbi:MULTISPECIES: HAD family hydrolase [unclassified Streptomyces]|uniref:HAD family hydrolase n=1 Tax=unclassified Streptomyces TaxID=2593676 RepID=UPI002E1D12C1|nr:HAD family hydrolase [Streptomyces sp. NBC_01023]
MQYELVIFDNSGVLVDSERVGNRLLAELLTLRVTPTTFEEAVEHYLGKSFRDVETTVRRRTGRTVPPGFLAEFHGRLFDAFADGLPVVEGVPEVLDGLDRAGVPYCVASNDTAERVSVSLKNAGLLPRVEGRIFSADMVPRAKPAPDLFLFAARSYGVEPRRCLVVEDSISGVTAAREAGMTVYAFAGLTPRSLLRRAHRVFDSMAELQDTLSGAGSKDIACSS